MNLSHSTNEASSTESTKLMYSKLEAAELLSLSVRTIENLIGNRELTVRRVGKRVLISYESLLRFIRQDHRTGKVQ
jgi:excisionase family DNA binding protein